MNTIVNYVLEANAGIIVLYVVYYFTMRNEQDFGKQRGFLLVSLVGSLLFPLVHISTAAAVPTLITVDSIQQVMLPELVITHSPRATQISPIVWITGAYTLIVLFLAIPLLINAWKILRVMRQSSVQVIDGFRVHESGEKHATSWSFFKVISIGGASQLSESEKQLIVQHEMQHGKLLHSLDILLISLVKIAFWFNPAVWMLHRAMARIHEFQVDKEVVQKSNPDDYCVLLAKTVLQQHGFALSHPFNQTFILKRINMINQIKSKISNWKVTVLMLAIVVYFFAVACTEQIAEDAAPKMSSHEAPAYVQQEANRLATKYPTATFKVVDLTNEPLSEFSGKLQYMVLDANTQRTWGVVGNAPEEDKIYTMVEKMPEPVNGMNDYLADLGSTLKYPTEARKQGLEGSVFIEFIIQKDGTATDFKILRGVHPLMDQEALRAIMTTGKWKAGEQGGVPVAARLVMPIKFKLN